MSQEKNPKMYKCDKCNDSFYISFEDRGYSYIKPCDCYYDAMVEVQFGSYFRGKTLENYEGRNSSMIKAKEIITGSINDSFFITGAVGLGKTHLLAGIYLNLLKTRRSGEMLVFTELQLLNKLITNEKEAQEEVRNLGNYKTIIIDDMGKIELKRWEQEKFFAFYNDMYRYKLQFIISSNYSLPEIGEIYGGAIQRRIEERARILEIKLPELLDS